MKTIYVAMGITLAPKEFREDFQSELKDALRKLPDVEVIDFIGLEKGAEQDVYHYDRKYTEESDLILAVCDHPALGLGMELAFRHVSGKPMLLFAHKDAKVTRMVLGFAEVEGYEFIRYEQVADIVAKVKEEIEKLN